MRTEREGKVEEFLRANGEKSAFGKACRAVPPPYGKVLLTNKEGEVVQQSGIALSRRQASKWLHQKGAAWKLGRS